MCKAASSRHEKREKEGEREGRVGLVLGRQMRWHRTTIITHDRQAKGQVGALSFF
jgi:hypothetical protein